MSFGYCNARGEVDRVGEREGERDRNLKIALANSAIYSQLLCQSCYIPSSGYKSNPTWTRPSTPMNIESFPNISIVSIVKGVVWVVGMVSVMRRQFIGVVVMMMCGRHGFLSLVGLVFFNDGMGKAKG